ncbi:MAG: FKBP-type peptidyl-prolyl cis-trans isomerase [Euryarchaeota archaeon]|nr:FKBP-type peptidyl-prolyl cis-trans isomerase [Euryarchaeota archaeon]
MTAPVGSRVLAAIAFVAALGVVLIAAQSEFGPHATPERRLSLVTPFDTLTGAPETFITLPLIVRNTGDVEETVNVTVRSVLESEVRLSGPSIIGPGNATGVFVVFHIPPEGADHVETKISARSGGAVANLDLVVNKLRALGLVNAGDTAVVDYVARLDDNTVAETNNAFVGGNAAFRRAGPPRFEALSPLNVTAGGASDIPGLGAAVEGMRSGESRTFLFTPAQAFGEKNASLERERRTMIDRSFTLDRTVSGPRFAFRLVNESSAVGDVIRLESGRNVFVYRIVALDAVNATLSFEASTGDTFTLILTPEGFVYPDFWTNETIVTAVTETNVTFTVFPTPGPDFTWFPYWPDSSRLYAINDESIVVEHDPPIGLKYREASGGRAIEATVADVADDVITVTVANSNPLAGVPVFFDIYVRGVVHET